MKQKALRAGDGHLHEDEECRKRPCSARECAEAHSYLKGVVDDERFYIQCTTGYYFWKRQFKKTSGAS